MTPRHTREQGNTVHDAADEWKDTQLRNCGTAWSGLQDESLVLSATYHFKGPGARLDVWRYVQSGRPCIKGSAASAPAHKGRAAKHLVQTPKLSHTATGKSHQRSCQMHQSCGVVLPSDLPREDIQRMVRIEEAGMPVTNAGNTQLQGGQDLSCTLVPACSPFPATRP